MTIIKYFLVTKQIKLNKIAVQQTILKKLSKFGKILVGTVKKKYLKIYSKKMVDKK